jgi:hydroxyacyl-ACP dehydratase HTD2-like protein with hotdog domain
LVGLKGCHSTAQHKSFFFCSCMGASTPLRRRILSDWSSCPPASWGNDRSCLFQELVLIMSNIKTQPKKKRSQTPHTSWRNNFLPEAWTKEKKQDKVDHQSENYPKLVSQSPVKETAATEELQVPDPHVTAALHGYQ